MNVQCWLMIEHVIMFSVYAMKSNVLLCSTNMNMLSLVNLYEFSCAPF